MVIFHSFPMKHLSFTRPGTQQRYRIFLARPQSLRRATKGLAKEALTSSSILKEVTASCCLGGKTMGPVEETYNP